MSDTSAATSGTGPIPAPIVAQETDLSEGQPAGQKKAPRWIVATVAIAFGLFYAFDLFEAVSTVIALPIQLAEVNEFRIANDLTPVPVPWTILVLNLLLPPLAFALAWWAGRRRGILYQALFFLLGLAVVAAGTLTLTALV